MAELDTLTYVLLEVFAALSSRHVDQLCSVFADDMCVSRCLFRASLHRVQCSMCVIRASAVCCSLSLIARDLLRNASDTLCSTLWSRFYKLYRAIAIDGSELACLDVLVCNILKSTSYPGWSGTASTAFLFILVCKSLYFELCTWEARCNSRAYVYETQSEFSVHFCLARHE